MNDCVNISDVYYHTLFFAYLCINQGHKPNPTEQMGLYTYIMLYFSSYDANLFILSFGAFTFYLLQNPELLSITHLIHASNWSFMISLDYKKGHVKVLIVRDLLRLIKFFLSLLPIGSWCWLFFIIIDLCFCCSNMCRGFVKVRYIGVSNETSYGVLEFVHAAKVGGLPKIVSIQNSYNLLTRCRFEGKYPVSISCSTVPQNSCLCIL